MSNQIQQITVATDDRVGLPGHCQREELIVIHITGDATCCAGVFVSERQIHQRHQERVPGLRLAIPVEPGSFPT